MAKNLHKYIAKELVKNVGTPLTTVSAKLAWLLRVHHLTDFDNGVKEKEKKREEKEEEAKKGGVHERVVSNVRQERPIS